jgi:hypothetical protein
MVAGSQFILPELNGKFEIGMRFWNDDRVEVVVRGDRKAGGCVAVGCVRRAELEIERSASKLFFPLIQ